MIVIAALVILIAFFGCCGAMKESKCLLGTYFTIILALFIVMIIGAFLGYSGNFEDTVKTPFEKALKKYDDQPAEDNQSAQNYKSVWNKVQAEVRRNRDGEINLANCLNLQLAVEMLRNRKLPGLAEHHRCKLQFPSQFQQARGVLCLGQR